MADPIALTLGEVHAWHGCIDERSSVLGQPRESDLAILSAGERARSRRFVRPADRVRFAATHAAVRRLLARYLAVGAADLWFGRAPCCECGSAEHGPPAIDWPPTDVTCNLSGSGDHWLLAVARGRRVGADVEVPRDVDAGQLARACLTAAEQRYLNAQQDDRQLDVFYRCWTRKEAVLKACGVGLSSSMRELDVAPGRAGPVEVRHRCKAGPDRWVVQDLPGGPGPGGAQGRAGTPPRAGRAAWLGAIAEPATEAGQVLLREADDA